MAMKICQDNNHTNYSEYKGENGKKASITEDLEKK